MLKLVLSLPVVAKLSDSPVFLRRLLGLSNKMFIKHSLKGQTCMKVFYLKFFTVSWSSFPAVSSELKVLNGLHFV